MGPSGRGLNQLEQMGRVQKDFDSRIEEFKKKTEKEGKTAKGLKSFNAEDFFQPPSRIFTIEQGGGLDSELVSVREILR